MDNASSPAVAASLPRHPKVRVITLTENYGTSAALNMGITHCTGHYVFITGDDHIVPPRAVAELLRFAETRQHADIIAARNVEYRGSKTVENTGTRVSKFTGRIYRYSNPDMEKPIGVANTIFMKKALFERLGGYDEDFFFSFEDTDLCERARRAGYGVEYCPSAVIYHFRHGKTETGKLPSIGISRQEEAFHSARGRLLFIRKHGGPLAAMLFCMAVLPFHMLRITVSSMMDKQPNMLYSYVQGNISAISRPRLTSTERRRHQNL